MIQYMLFFYVLSVCLSCPILLPYLREVQVVPIILVIEVDWAWINLSLIVKNLVFPKHGPKIKRKLI